MWKIIRKEIAGPGFLVGVPVYMEPLAKKSEKDPRVVERFQVIIAGSEIGKGFSELNDPVDQAERFKRQQQLREAGDEEAQCRMPSLWRRSNTVCRPHLVSASPNGFLVFSKVFQYAKRKFSLNDASTVIK